MLFPTYYAGASFCLVTTSITAAKTVNNPPNTTASVFSWNSLTLQSQTPHLTNYLNIFLNVYDLTYLGTYTFTVVYTWGNPLNTVTRTQTINILDGCLTKVTPPASIANPYRSLLDFDDSTTWLNVAPVFTLPYTMCKYSISMTAVKTTTPDTTTSAISFTPMFQKAYTDLASAVIHYIGGSTNYDLSLIGDYTVTMTYSWGGFNINDNVIVRTFTYTVQDCCYWALAPPIIASVTSNVSDPDFTKSYAPTIAAGRYQTYCVFSIPTVTITKSTTPDTTSNIHPTAFTPISNGNYLSTANDVFTISNLNYANAGLYTITVNYSWGGTGASFTAQKTWTLTLINPCSASVTVPSFTSTTANLLDANTSWNVSPIIAAQYQFCLCSI